jgi:hypothetical protein
MSAADLDVEVHDGDIVVTLPCTRYTVTYYKPLIRRSFWQSVSPARTIHTLA